jgi:PAS domain S-box-containing protein
MSNFDLLVGALVVTSALVIRLWIAQRKLRLKHRQNQAIFDGIADSFFVLDRTGAFAMVTPKAEQMLGQSRSKLFGKSLQQSFAALHRTEFHRRVERALADHTPCRFEDFTPTVNCWLEHQIYPIGDGGIAVHSRDITARHRLEEALKASEERFQKLADANVMGICHTEGTRITEANSLFLQMTGQSRDELVRSQLDWSDFADPEQRDLEVFAARQLRQQRFCSPYERTLVRRDGERLCVLVGSIRTDGHATEVEPADWQTLHVVHDLTDQKRVEVRLRLILEAAKILNASLDLNTMLEELAQFIGSHLGDGCAIYLDWDGELRCVAESERTGNALPHAAIMTSSQMNRVLIKGRPEVIPDSGVIVPLPSRGKIAGAVFTAFSTQPAKPLPAEDIHLLEEIGRSVGVSLENIRLYAETQASSCLKDEFVAALSHELRTPLTPILGAVYMLRSEPHDQKIFSKALDLIERNANAQAKIVEDLLDVSNIISGKLRLRQEPVDMESAILAAAESVRPAREAKNIEIAVELGPLTGVVYGDHDRLRQIFWNILSNSVKFTPAGGSIKVEQTENSGHVAVRITDTGKGIPQEFLPFVFDRFVQEDRAKRKMQSGGLGLGLAIVRHLVESHGGTVQAYSLGDHKGSTFVVTLPLRSAARAATPS